MSQGPSTQPAKPALASPAGLHLYVDGSPGRKRDDSWSGWGLALVYDGEPLHLQCGTTDGRVSSNAAELEAVIQGLALISRQKHAGVIPLWTDSSYTAEMIARLPALAANHWRDRKDHPVKNPDRLKLLYEMLHLMELAERTTVRWVKGHAKNPGNEMADRLSKLAAYRGVRHSFTLP